MFSNLNIFQTASALSEHATTRQNAISKNIANADTPGYRAKDIAEFGEVFHKSSLSIPLKTTRSTHYTVENETYSMTLQAVETPGNESPNGNNVSLETEMVKAAEVKFSHDLALTIYRSGLNILRTSLGGGR